MEKLKAFFKNKWTKIIAWVVLALCTLALILGGVSAETISGGIVLVAGYIAFVIGTL